jgi:hypothetical protein
LLQIGFVTHGDRFGPRGSAPGPADVFVDHVTPHGSKALVCLYVQESKKRRKIYDLPSPWRALNFIVAADFPIARVHYRASSNHVQVDVSHASGQVAVSLHCRRVISILPKSPATLLARVKLLSDSSLYQLQRARYLVSPLVCAKQVNVIAGGYVIQNGQAIAPFCLKKPVSPAAPVAHEFQEKLSLMAAMRDMPDVAGAEDAVSSGHLEESSILGHK